MKNNKYNTKFGNKKGGKKRTLDRAPAYVRPKKVRALRLNLLQASEATEEAAELARGTFN